MAWFKYLALIGIIGVAHADLICYATIAPECPKEHNLELNLCINGASYNISTCVQESAKTCKVDTDKDIVDLVAKTADICKHGTKANKDYKQFWSCIAQSRFYPPICDAELNIYLMDLAKKGLPQDKFIKESLKAKYCKFAASINKCTVEKVREKCPAGAENFSLYLQTGPAERINKKICDLLNGVGKIL